MGGGELAAGAAVSAWVYSRREVGVVLPCVMGRQDVDTCVASRGVHKLVPETLMSHAAGRVLQFRRSPSGLAVELGGGCG